MLTRARHERAAGVEDVTDESPQGGWSTDIPRFHLRENISRANEELAARIADASAAFWRHVREALDTLGHKHGGRSVRRA